MSSLKRKRARRGSPDYTAGGERPSAQVPAPSALFVQAHEATIIRDRPDVARALTARDHGGGRGGLIQWQGDEERGAEIWVDSLRSSCIRRYDARLLLSSLPSPGARANAPPPSPTGWSDLPSDTEDTFFFTPDELEDIQREKRRKLADAGRAQRLRALQEEPVPDPAGTCTGAGWGGDAEEPGGAQRTLMERTARHLAVSPNAGQLEMRILANHGADERFAFLRGRWRDAWQAIRRAEEEAAAVKGRSEGGRLVAYGDSDEDGDGEGEGEGEGESGSEVLCRKVYDSEKEARRARAREWACKRKESKSISQ